MVTFKVVYYVENELVEELVEASTYYFDPWSEFCSFFDYMGKPVKRFLNISIKSIEVVG